MATGALALSLLLVSVAGANPTYVLLDSVNIGNTASEAGHSLNDWTNVWSGCGWCGPDGNMRLIWGDGGETCDLANNWASVTLDAGSAWAQTLRLSHLDGAADDGFNVFVNDDLVGTYVATPATQNVWYTDDFDISSGLYAGVLTIKLQATGIAWGGCGTYGQVAFDLIELYGGPVPATIDIDPDTLNLKSKGSFITAYIELPEGFDVNLIDVCSVMLNETVFAELSPTAIGDYDTDGVPEALSRLVIALGSR
jgi:hypothetical protein